MELTPDERKVIEIKTADRADDARRPRQLQVQATDEAKYGPFPHAQPTPAQFFENAARAALIRFCSTCNCIQQFEPIGNHALACPTCRAAWTPAAQLTPTAYEWNCPFCGRYHQRADAPLSVTCESCEHLSLAVAVTVEPV